MRANYNREPNVKYNSDTMMTDGNGKQFKTNSRFTHGAPEKKRTKGRRTKSLKVRANRLKAKAKARR